MTKISSLTALTGAGVDGTADLLPIVDMSEAGTARNKKITIDEAKIALDVPAAIAELDDIPDVNAPAPTNGDVLTWDSTPGEWVSTAPTTGATTLDGLTDVNAPTPSNNDVLTWDSTPGEWVAQAPSGGVNALDDLSDVDTTGQTSGDVLTYDGADWVPQAPSGGATACPAIRSSNLTKHASAASFSHSLPAGAAAGDFCIIFYSGGFGDPSITLPATALWDTFRHTATNWNGALFARRLTAADITAGAVTITPTGSFDAVIGAVCFTGEAQLRYPILEQSARAGAVHAPGAGATSSAQVTAYASADDCIVTFLSNRASSTDTSDHGSQLQTTTNANGSGAIYANEAPSAGGQTANLAYSTAGTGRYEIMLVVRGPN